MPRSVPAMLCVWVLALPLFANGQASPPHRACSFHAQITDEDGGALRAFAMLRTKRTPVANQTVPVDARGQLRVNLAPGFYDLFVAAPGYQPLAQTVDLRACHPVDLNLTLFFNPDEHQDGEPK